MTTLVNPSPVLDLNDSIRLLNRRLDFALAWHFDSDAREVGIIARYLARRVGTAPLQAIVRRASATVKLLESSRYV